MMSKKTKIVLWAVIAVVLTALLVWGIAGATSLGNTVSKFFATLSVGDFVDKLPDNAQTSDKFEVPDAQQISQISMRFVDEDIELVLTDEAVIRVEETSGDTIKKEDMMHHSVKKDALVVQSGRAGRMFGWINNYKIKVRVMIPRSYSGVIDIQSVSGTLAAEQIAAVSAIYTTTAGDITINGGVCEDMRVKSISGDIGITDAKVGHLRADTTSGKIDARGAFERVNAVSTSGELLLEAAGVMDISTDTTSGSTKIKCADAENLESVSASSVSGNVEIMLPSDCGFMLRYDTMSGSEDNGFVMRGGISGDGMVDIGVDTISGSLRMAQNN
ncbi:MAG: DUF4097 family beta strand repeat-containing protein [Christensenella sp.]